MSESRELTVIDMVPVSPEVLQKQVRAIQTAMKSVMKEGTHFGLIPGCGDKPSLFKPGAEKLGLMFRLVASFDVRRLDLVNGHREFDVTCTLKDLHGNPVGQGVGSGSTMESKYRYRAAERKCPSCGKATIIKGRDEYGGGWLCYGKKGGCGAKFQDGDKSIEGQQVGKVENPDIADVYNTVLKMAKKRAHVDAVLTCTAASDCFTQDVEDFPQYDYSAAVVPEKPAPTGPAAKLTDTELDPEVYGKQLEKKKSPVEPLENPWLYKLTRNKQTKFLAEVDTKWFNNAYNRYAHGQMSDEEWANVDACLNHPETEYLKQVALEEIAGMGEVENAE